MYLLTSTEQLIGKQRGRKQRLTVRLSRGVGIPLVGGSHRSHWQVFDSSEASRVAATCCSAAINGRNVPIIQVWGVRAGRKRAAGDTTQPAIPLARITTGWACQISIAALFQTITVRTKVPDHGELFRARRWSGKVQRLKSTVVGTSGSVRPKSPAILFAAWAEPHRTVAPANSRAAQVVFKRFSGVKVRGEKSRGEQKVDFSCFLVAKLPVDTPSCGRIPPDRLLWV